MNNDIFINIAFDAAIKKYMLFKSKQDYSLASSFLVYVVCMLIYIYSEADIINPYINKDSSRKNALLKNLTKYSLDSKWLNKFFNDLSGFYEKDNYNKIVGDFKNPYFTYVQEDLIEMYLAKYQSLKLDSSSLKEFRKLLFEPNSKNKFRNQINEKYAINPAGAVNYFDKRVYELSSKLDFYPIKDNVLAMSIYETFGLSKEDLEIINQETLNNINNNIYAYFKVNPIEVNAKEKLNNQVMNLQKRKYLLSTNSGKTNILIFLIIFSVIIVIGIFVGLKLLG